VSNNDGSLRLQVLRRGKTDGSRMGEVRKCWREHLCLSSDDEIYALLDGLDITQGHSSLEKMRHDVSLRFNLVRLVGAEDETAGRHDPQQKRDFFNALLARDDRVNCSGKFNIALRDAARVMCGQPDLKPIIHVEPLRVMIPLFRNNANLNHGRQRFREIAELQLPIKGLAVLSVDPPIERTELFGTNIVTERTDHSDPR
jgi:hypothetical protein